MLSPYFYAFKYFCKDTTLIENGIFFFDRKFRKFRKFQRNTSARHCGLDPQRVPLTLAPKQSLSPRPPQQKTLFFRKKNPPTSKKVCIFAA